MINPQNLWMKLLTTTEQRTTTDRCKSISKSTKKKQRNCTNKHQIIKIKNLESTDSKELAWESKKDRLIPVDRDFQRKQWHPGSSRRSAVREDSLQLQEQSVWSLKRMNQQLCVNIGNWEIGGRRYSREN